MQDVHGLIDLLLAQLTPAGVPVGSSPDRVLIDSLDQLRFLVALEERLGMALDDADVLPFDVTSREALQADVDAKLLRQQDGEPA